MDKGGHLVSISNGFKWESVLKNKLKNDGKLVYQSPNSKSNTHELLQTSQSSINTIDKESIAQDSTNTTKNIKEFDNLSNAQGSFATTQGDGMAKNAESARHTEPPTRHTEPQGEKSTLKNTETTQEKQLSKKIKGKLGDDSLSALPKASQQEYNDFLQKAQKGDYQNMPEILKIANLPREAQTAMNSDRSEVFITKAIAGHTREARKAAFNQNIPITQKQKIPQILENIKSSEIYQGGGSGFVIPFESIENGKKNLIVLDKDSSGNFIVTLKSINNDDFNSGMYKPIKVGVEPTTTTQKAQSSTESISLSSNDILPQDSKNAKENLSIIKREDGDILVRDENGNAKIVRPAKEFGTNYAEFYHDGQNAIKKLLQEAQSAKANGNIESFKAQVAGAFYRKELGDIDLVWGQKGTGKSDGWGLAKIAEYHPEVIDKLDELVNDLPIVKESANRYQLENDMYKLSIRKDFEGQKGNWVLTAFEKDESIARRRTDLPSSQSETEKTTSVNANDILPQKHKENIKTRKNGDILVRDENGKGNILRKETQDLWLKTFDLKSLDEPYIPQFKQEVQEALNPILQGEQIKLTKGSLIKLTKREREKFIPYIKETLENSDVILDDGKGILFLKEFISDKERYFMSVAKNYNGEWIFSSHYRKDLSGIKKKIKESKVIYNNGFKGGEVASASDIIKSGGTYSKPSDLQIEYPSNQVSGKNPSGILS